MKMAESPDAIRHANVLNHLFVNSPQQQGQLLRDRAIRFINNIFWNKSLPLDSIQHPRLGIYEMLRRHGRVFGCLGNAIPKEHLDFINAANPSLTFGVAASHGVLEWLSSRIRPLLLSHHPFFEDREFLDLPNRIWLLPWEEIVIGENIVIPNPEQCLILEDFSLPNA